jgi:NADH-quinone oxidoreductase subunit L
MPDYYYIILIPLLPLLSFVVLGLSGKKSFPVASGIGSTLVMGAATILSFYTAWQYFFVSGNSTGAYQKIRAVSYSWLEFYPGMSIDMGILLDPISMMMIVVVCFISLMVHIFSLGYMKGEKRYSTYFAFLSLFTFSMIGLVLSTNIFQIYIFWELVGVSSFLLIGFYYDRPSAVAASKKAFIVTRFADLGFLIGILVLGFNSGTLDFGLMIERLTSTGSPESLAMASASFLGLSALTWGLLLVFMGGAGKSAMFPLHIWLPDAMEGPTPVSALIHAATMVVAGVYLVARLFPVFAMDMIALNVVMYVGAFSAFIAAVIACTQTDIKRVLAYSTMSQIGYMMLALGVAGFGGLASSGFTGSMFHLFTHAFFKSLLFLGAGAVIHFIHSNEMKDMGGLRKYMPITHLSFLIACLAIAGIPPFAGFFSKEVILLSAFHNNHFIYYLALLTAGLTAFYMFRLYFSIFWNKEIHVEHHHGEGSLSMKIPLIVLAILTIFSGLVPFGNYISSDGFPLASHFEISFAIMPVALAVAGIILAAWLYKNPSDKPAKIASSMGALYRAAFRKFYIDEIYLFITKRIIFNLIGRPAAWFDKNVVDGFMNLLGVSTAYTSEKIKYIQSGRVQGYAIYFFASVLALAIIFIYLWK